MNGVVAVNVAAGALAVLRAALLGAAVVAVRSLPKLEKTPLLAEEDLPLVTLLVPAKDEEATIEHALRSKLALDYPKLEILVVDDRSTDRTSEIAARLASESPRVRVMRIDTLPAGWLGKLHALDCGMREAKGEWILISDADVELTPDTLRLAIAHAHDADFLALLPLFDHIAPAVDALMSEFLHSLMLFARADKVADPKSPLALGGGVFNLFRRSAYDRTPGFSWLKLEVGDDIAFGQMMKRAGGRTRVADGSRNVRVVIYASVRAFIRGMGKGIWPVVARFSVVRLALITGVQLFIHASPLLFLFAPSLFARACAAAAIVFSIAASIASNTFSGRRAWPSVCAPLAGTFTAALTLVIGLVQCAQGGITWRGTFYSTAVLRTGQRMTPPWKL